jgi:hypothetical protein
MFAESILHKYEDDGVTINGGEATSWFNNAAG